VKIFGLYWYKKMKEEEWNSKKHKVVVILENIHNEKDL
jgi:hypothetical protein